MNDAYASLLQENFPWDRWERLILSEGFHLDRPQYTPHPKYPEIIYPMDYGYICNTMSSDGAEVDLFVGSGEDHLVGLIVTQDYRQGDQEIKLLWRCLPTEIYLCSWVHQFRSFEVKGSLGSSIPNAETLGYANEPK